jgi:hypothetical protein
MPGFYFENHNNIKVESGQHSVQIGALDLEPGAYMVWGKFSFGINVAGGYPPPAWPYAAGVAFLSLGEADDSAYYGLKPESAENNGAISLMCATTITRALPARIHVLNLYPLPVYCHQIKLMAIQLDSLVEREVGTDNFDAPRDKEQALRERIIRGEATDRKALSELLKKA